MFKQSFVLTLSTIGLQGAKFLTYLYAAKLLGPKTYGLWNGLLLILTYGMNSHMGVLNAMNREIPFYEGAGRQDAIEEIRNLSAGALLYSATPLTAIVFFAGFWPSLDPETATGLKYVAFILLLQQFYLFFQMLFRSHGLFMHLSKQQIYYAILLMVMVLGFTRFFGFSGFLMGQVLSNAIILAYVRLALPVKIRPVFVAHKIYHLAKIGFPIMAVGVAYGMLTTIDRVMILKYLGTEQLGFYSLSIMATGLLTLLPMTVAQVVYPKMASKYGETRDPLALRELIYRPTYYLSMIMAIILVLTYFVLPPIITIFLPAYSQGVSALKITVWGVFFLSLVGGFANFLNVVGYQRSYLMVQIVTIAILVILNLVCVGMKLGLMGIAVSTSLTYVIYALIMIALTTHILRKHEKASAVTSEQKACAVNG